MTLASVSRGKLEKPFRVLVYGVEGVGKSTFAAGAPDTIFLCAEEGTAHLDVARFPSPQSFADVVEAIRVLMYEKHTFKTLAIDTVDWLEPLVWQHVCAMGRKNNIEEFGYGKGYTAALDQWRILLTKLEELTRSRAMNVILIAHAQVKKQEDPDVGAFDRYRMKLHDRAGDLLREWCDAVLFARYEVAAVEKRGRIRGVSNGSRILHTQWTAAFDAKNRFDLPDQIALSWDEFAAAAKRGAPAEVKALRAEIEALIPRLKEREKAEKTLREWAGENPARLAQLLDKVRTKVAMEESGPAELPAPGNGDGDHEATEASP